VSRAKNGGPDGALTPEFDAFDALVFTRLRLVVFEHRKLNVQHRTSNDGFAALSQILKRQDALFDVGRSMFDVGRSNFRVGSLGRSRF
jgi:hypothetical protein